MNYKSMQKFGSAGSSATTKKNDTVNSVAVSEHEKSKLDLSYKHITTFNAGKVVPIFQLDVFPGDVVSIDCATLLRMSMPSAPTLDSPRYDIDFFFIPYKQVWDKFSYLIGTSYDGGKPIIVDKVPTINFDTSFTYQTNDLADHMNIPVNVDMSKTGLSISSLPFKAYVKLWNEWFRDENLIASADFSNFNNPDSDLNVSTFSTASLFNQVQIGKGLLPSCRLRDYFASSLPFIQKGSVPLIATLSASDIQQMFDDTSARMSIVNGNPSESKTRLPLYLTDSNGNSLISGDNTSPLVVNGAGGAPNWVYANSTSAGGDLGSQAFLNLFAVKNDSNSFSYNGSGVRSFNITDLRNAIVTQHQNELDARAGTRYYEKLLAYWGVELNPLEIGRTQLLGGFSGTVNIQNIVQSAPATSADLKQTIGNIAGVSVTGGKLKNTIHCSIEQYGIIIGVITVRTNLTYSQGLPKLFTKKANWDFYNPLFNGISEQPIYKHELYLSENSDDNIAIFGYNQPFADLKYKFNVASGLISANASESLYEFYSYQNKLGSSPTLTNDWIKYPASALENTLLINSATSHKEFINDFLADFAFGVTVLREIPAYSIPGIDKI